MSEPPAKSWRRLEDRIRDLCTRLANANDSEIASILKQLQDALAEHNRRMRKMAAKKLTGGAEESEDRRSS